MGLSDPRIVYGVHSFSPYSRSTGLPFGVAKVLAGSTFTIAGELVEQFGGSNKFAWAVEEGNVNADIALSVKQIEDWMFELFLGKAPTASGAAANGTVSALVDKNGTLVDATGIASVAAKAGSEGDLKFTKYVVVAVSATTVDVYALSDVDFQRGADTVFEDDLLKITAAPLTIVTATPVTIPGYGLELTGGAGTIGMDTDDTAEFEVIPQSDKSMEVTIGASGDTFPVFGAIMVAQQRGNGEMFEIDAFRCKGSGLPLGLAEKAFGEAEIAVKAFYDSAKNGIAKVRWVDPEL